MRTLETVSTALDLVGRTPLLLLESFSNEDVRFFAKLEGYNPGGSMKDRPARFMIEQAERQGLLQPGGLIIESSSGNLGISLAMIGAIKGYRVRVVLDPRTSPTNMQIMNAYGAELELVETPHPTGGFQQARIDRVKQLLKEHPGAYWTNQYANFENPSAHYFGTAKEIYDAMDGQVDCLVVPVSSSGLLTGCGQFFKERCTTHIVAVDAVGSTIFGGEAKPRQMIGIGGNVTPPNLRREVVDEVCMIHDEESFAMCRELVDREALLVGPSSGAAMAAALKVAPTLPKSKGQPLDVAVLFPDNGDRYLTTFLQNLTQTEREKATVAL